MGFLSRVTRSWRKSSKLRKLQLKIAPPGRGIDDAASDIMRSLSDGTNEKETALVEYLAFCESDEGVKKVMDSENLSREDLRDIYFRLLAVGLGQWIKGHYAALSTIAYVEPLLYTVRSQRHGSDWMEVAGNLLAYWENEISQGSLLQQIQ